MGKYIKGKKFPKGVINSVMKPESGGFVCTLSATPTPPEPSKAGYSLKTLQKLLDHFSLKMTMDRYVHVTDDSMEMGIRLFEQGQLENGLSAANGA